VVFAVLARALWKTYEWYREWFIRTPGASMLTMGVLTRKITMIRLGKVTDMSYVFPPVGQILGYGSFILESAGQDQAFREVEHVPRPDLLYRRSARSSSLRTRAAPATARRRWPGPSPSRSPATFAEARGSAPERPMTRPGARRPLRRLVEARLSAL
jgi:Bacterial PH domain